VDKNTNKVYYKKTEVAETSTNDKVSKRSKYYKHDLTPQALADGSIHLIIVYYNYAKKEPMSWSKEEKLLPSFTRSQLTYNIITDIDVHYIHNYTKNYYKDLNTYLWSNQQITTHTKDSEEKILHICHICSYITKNRVVDKKVFVRVMLLDEEEIAAYKPGTLFTWKAFTSSSDKLVKSGFKYSVIFIIFNFIKNCAPSSFKIHSQYPNENEYVFLPYTSFQVLLTIQASFPIVLIKTVDCNCKGVENVQDCVVEEELQPLMSKTIDSTNNCNCCNIT